jgi:hypothetical protein
MKSEAEIRAEHEKCIEAAVYALRYSPAIRVVNNGEYAGIIAQIAIPVVTDAIRSLAAQPAIEPIPGITGDDISAIEEIVADRHAPPATVDAEKWVDPDVDWPVGNTVVFITDGKDVGLGVKIPVGWKILSGHMFKPTRWQPIKFPSPLAALLPDEVKR